MRWRIVGAMGAVLLLSACGQAGSTVADTSSAPVLDCGLARMAMDDYSIALRELAVSLQAGDAMSAIGAADTMSFALDQLEVALPGIPASGGAFLDASRGVALQVKQSAAESPAMEGLLDELTESFADPAFAEGGDAIEAYADQVCPAASESPAP